MASLSVRSPPIGNGQGTSRIASFIPKSLSSSADSISKNTVKASDYIFNALTPSPESSRSSPAQSSPSWFSNNITSPEGAAGAASASAGTDSGSPSFFSYFIRFILVAALVAFAGFNIFTQMGIATDEIVKFADPVVRPIMNLLGMITKQTVSSTASGTKTGIDIVSGATKSGVNVIEDQIVGSYGDRIHPSGNGDARQERARANALTMKTGTDSSFASGNTVYPEADDASSVTQKGKVSGKAGFCLVGEDRGIRSCMRVGEGDTCMSGNIFPSKDVCINPSLRI